MSDSDPTQDEMAAEWKQWDIDRNRAETWLERAIAAEAALAATVDRVEVLAAENAKLRGC